MKKHWYCFLSNLFFYAGHIVSKPMHWHDELGRLYPLYNYLMIRSVDFNDVSDCGIWGKIQQ